MIDKHRHSHLSVPHGSLPNWVLIVLIACAIAIAGLAHSIL
jgi:predicted hotdog family 3-hydroxylacyl-ACP dehydratase